MRKKNQNTLKELINSIQKKSKKKITNKTDLINDGIFDSFGFIELLLDLETKLNLKINMDDIERLELTSFKNLNEYLKKKSK